MNTVIVVLVAAFCVVQVPDATADPLGVLKAQLEIAKGKVNRVINDLTRSKNNLAFDLDQKLYNTKFAAMNNINGMVNPAMEQIRNAVKAAKDEGKNADHCLESGRLALRDVSQNAFASIDTCHKNAKQLIVPAQNNMDATISVARQLLSELDRIFLNCYSSNIWSMQSCITMALANANISINNLESTANTVKSSGTTAANSAFLEGTSCFNNVVTSARPQVQPAVDGAKACISNV